MTIHRRAFGAALAVLAVLAVALPTMAQAEQLPSETAVSVVDVAAADRAVDLAWRVGDATLFVVEQAGLIRPLRGDGSGPLQFGEPVLDIRANVSTGGEQGLLGLAFSPDGRTAYVNLTDVEGNTQVVAYAVGSDGVFDPRSAKALLTVNQPYPNHNGGNLAVDTAGMLYVATGDGGAAGDPQRHALDLSSPLGKLLRIDPTRSTNVAPVAAPDNPFIGQAGALDLVWSYGLRNPWRITFDSLTHDVWIADVGQNEWEEINHATAADGAGRGTNFGWSAWEGNHRFNDDQPADGAVPPIFEYEHGDDGCSVSGAAVAHDAALPVLEGWFVFSDYCSGVIRALRHDDSGITGPVVIGRSEQVAALRSGPNGEVYVLSQNRGIQRLNPAGA